MKYYLSVKPDQIAEEVAEQARQLVEVASNPEEADIIAAIGGDGGFIHTIYHYHQFGKPFVGVNGGSEGAHCLVRRHALETGFARIEQIQPIQMSFLAVEYDGLNDVAVQDVRIERRNGKTIRAEIKINGRIIARRHVGDGILVSNSLGSTGYNRSAGGAVLPLTSNLICLTPICPTFARVVFDNLMESLILESCTIEITPEDRQCLVIDNRDVFVEGGTTVKVSVSNLTYQIYPEEAR